MARDILGFGISDALDPQAAPKPVDAKSRIEALAAQHRVPPNLLMAIEEAGGRVDVDAPLLGQALAAGKAPDAALAERFGDPAKAAAVLNRAYDIADELYPRQAAPEAAKSEPGVVGDFGRMLGGSLVRGAGLGIKGLGIAAEEIATGGQGLPEGSGPTIARAMADRAGGAVAGWGEAIQGGVSQATKAALAGSQPDGVLWEPSTWTMGTDPSLRGYTMLAADVFGSLLPVVATAVVTRSPAAAAAAGGAMSGGAGADTARKAIVEMANTAGPDGNPLIATESAYYRELRARGMDHAQATETTARAAERLSWLQAGVVGAAGGAATGVILGPVSKAMAGGGLAARTAGTGALSAVEEGAQEVAETVATRTGINQAAGTNLDPMEGTFGDALLGAIGGAPFGAAAGALARRPEETPGADGSGVGAGAAPPPPPQGGAASPAGGVEPPLDTPAAATGPVPEPPGPAQRAAGLAPDMTPQPEAPQRFPDVKPGKLVRILPPGGGPVYEATFLREEPGQVVLRIDGEEIAVDDADFDMAMADARQADLDAKAKATGKPPQQAPVARPGQGTAGPTGPTPPATSATSATPGEQTKAPPRPPMAPDSLATQAMQNIAKPKPPEAPTGSVDKPAEPSADPVEALWKLAEAGKVKVPGEKDRSPVLALVARVKKAGGAIPRENFPDFVRAAESAFRVPEERRKPLTDAIVARYTPVKETANVGTPAPKPDTPQVDQASGVERPDQAGGSAGTAETPVGGGIRGAEQPAGPGDDQAGAGDAGQPVKGVELKEVANGQEAVDGTRVEGSGEKRPGQQVGRKEADEGDAQPRPGGLRAGGTGSGVAQGSGPDVPAPQGDVRDPALTKGPALQMVDPPTPERAPWWDTADDLTRRTILKAADLSPGLATGKGFSDLPEKARKALTDAFGQLYRDGKIDNIGTIEEPRYALRGETIDAVAVTPPEAAPGETDSTPAPVAAAAPEINPDPTPAQKEAGNYKKGHARWKGLDLTVENEKGSIRSKEKPDGTVAWQVTMPAHYGYFKRTEGKDGDHVDFYMGDNEDSESVWVIDQIDLKTGKFDEHKVMLGMDTAQQAADTYARGFSDGNGRARMGGIRKMTADELKAWIKDGDTTQPVSGRMREKKGKAKASPLALPAPEAAPQAQPAAEPAKAAAEENAISLKVERNAAGKVVSAQYLRWVYGKDLAQFGEHRMVRQPEGMDFNPAVEFGFTGISSTYMDGHRGQGNFAYRPVSISGKRYAVFARIMARPESEIAGVPSGARSYTHVAAIAVPIDAFTPEVVNGAFKALFYGLAGNPERGVEQDSTVGVIRAMAGEAPANVRGDQAFIIHGPRGLPPTLEGKYDASATALEDLQIAATLPIEDDRQLTKRQQARDSGRAAGKAGEDRTPPAFLNEELQREWLAGYAKGKAEAPKVEPPAPPESPPELPKTEETAATARPKATPTPQVAPMAGTSPLGVKPDQEAPVTEADRIARRKERAPWSLAGATKTTLTEDEGFELGRKHFRDGYARLVPTEITLKHGHAVRAWYRGWDEANLAEPIPEPRPEPAPAPKPLPTPPKKVETAAPPPAPAGLKGLTEAENAELAALEAEFMAMMKGQLNAGLDPKMVSIAFKIGTLYVKAGTRRFRALLDAMMQRMGLTLEQAQPYARNAYNQIRDDMELAGESVRDMDTADEVIREIRKMREAASTPAPEPATVPQETPEAGNGDGLGSGGDRSDAGSQPQNVPQDVGRRQGDASGAADLRAGEGDVRPAEPAGTDIPRVEDAAGAGRRVGEGRGGRDGFGGNRPRNYRIPPGGLNDTRSEKARAKDSIDAIRLLKSIEAQNRRATPDEQKRLALYAGAGSLNPAVPNSDGSVRSGWESLASDLRSLVSKDEMDTIARTTQYAFYTSEEIVRAMWGAVERLGFKGGTVFEPGMGVGHFLGMSPQSLDGKLTYRGIELDSITARIARQLYPESTVQNQDYTAAQVPQDFYDLAIGNPPFANIPITSDKKYPQRFLLHDYFFAKTMDAVRPGGLLAFITSEGTMNKMDDAARRYLAERADLVGAIRLPNTAFKDNAGTEVTTDVIFLRKRMEGEAAGDQSWLQVDMVPLPGLEGARTTEFKVNRYFVQNPDMILGDQGGFGTQRFRGQYAVVPRKGTNLSAAFDEAVRKLPANVMSDRPYDTTSAQDEVDPDSGQTKAGSFYVKDGALWQFTGSVGVKVKRRTDGGKTSQADYDKAIRFVAVRDALRATYAADLGGDTAAAEAARKALNDAYDAFVAKHGPINKSVTSYQRPRAAQMERHRAAQREAALEEGRDWSEGSFDPTPYIDATMLDEGTDADEDSDTPSGPVLGAAKPEGKKYTWTAIARMRKEAKDRLGDAYDDGSFDPEAVPDLEIVKRENLNAIMDDPEVWRIAALEKYDSETGTATKTKVFSASILARQNEPEIRDAKDGLNYSMAARGFVDLDLIADRAGISRQSAINDLAGLIFMNPETGRWENRDAYLSGNVRDKLKAAQAIGGPEMEPNVAALLQVMPRELSEFDITVSPGMPWIPVSVMQDFAKAEIGVRVVIDRAGAGGRWSVDGDKDGTASRVTWGTNDVPFPELFEKVLNRVIIKVQRTHKDAQGKTTTHLDEAATQAANEKADLIRRRFADWVWKDDARKESLLRIYNDRFNSTVAPTFDGSYLTTPGIAAGWSWRPHQLRAIARILQSGSTYLAHAVGAGKTSEMIAAAMEARRLGIARKPMFAVPNHMLGQFAAEFYEHYPTANIIVADDRRFHGSRRKQFIADAAANDYDAIVLTHSSFQKLPVSDTLNDEFVQAEIERFDEAIRATKADGDRITTKEMERAKERLEQRLRGARDTSRVDAQLTFEEMGVDMLFVDEAHLFRKLDFATQLGALKGITPSGSQMAWDLFLKTRHLERVNPGRGIVLASGTPITNTMAELFTLSRYIQYDTLEKQGLLDFDSWAQSYGETAIDYEPDAAGNYKAVSRFSKFVNTRDLSLMVRERMDTVIPEDLEKYVLRPKLAGGSRTAVPVPRSPEVAGYQEHLAARMKALEERKGPPKKGDDNHLVIIGDGIAAATDMRLINERIRADDSKLTVLAENLLRIHRETENHPFYKPNPETRAYSSEPAMTGPAAQMVFADIQRRPGKSSFDTHQFIKDYLVRNGVPEEQIALFRNFKNTEAKRRLFRRVNDGEVRVLIGSAKAMGTGVNAQKRLVAMHNLDPHWYPALDEQRVGRILRQGNWNREIQVFDYATKGTYDSTMWQMMGRKARTIEDFLRGDPNVNEMEDVGPASVFEQLAGMTTPDPRILRLKELQEEVKKLQRRRSNAAGERRDLDARIRYAADSERSWSREKAAHEAVMPKHVDLRGKAFSVQMDGEEVTDRKEFGERVEAKARAWALAGGGYPTLEIGRVNGVPIQLSQAGKSDTYGDIIGLPSAEEGKSVEAVLRLPFSRDVVRKFHAYADPVDTAKSLTQTINQIPENIAYADRRINEHRSDRAKATAALESFEGFKDGELLAQRTAELQSLLKELDGQGIQKPEPTPRRKKTFEMRMEDDGGIATQESRGWAEVEPAAPTTDADIRKITIALNAEMQRTGLSGKIPARVVREVTTKTLFGVERRPKAEGNFGPLGIQVKAGAAAGEIGVLRHEIIHALRNENIWGKPYGLFTQAEWRALVKAARADKGIMDRVRELYPDLSADKQIEEAVAELYRLWREGGEGVGLIQKAFERIQAFFRALANALRGEGFADAARTMDMIATGKIGRRMDRARYAFDGAQDMRAYHGTPHQFDRFDLGAIGTGEGAQAYGWGLYFAGKREVAEWYKKNLSRPIFKGPLGIVGPEHVVARAIDAGLPQAAAGDAYEALVDMATGRSSANSISDVADRFQAVGRLDVASPLRTVVLAGYELERRGRLYTVEIPDDSDLLDWDAPLSEQPEKVKAALKSLGIEERPIKMEWRTNKDQHRLFVVDGTGEARGTGEYLIKSKSGGWDIYRAGKYGGALMKDTLENEAAKSVMREAEASAARYIKSLPNEGRGRGADAYYALSRKFKNQAYAKGQALTADMTRSGQGWTPANLAKNAEIEARYQNPDKAASEALRAAGIPGHRYFDGNSRTDSHGTRNYVIYDDAKIDIVAAEMRGDPLALTDDIRRRLVDSAKEQVEKWGASRAAYLPEHFAALRFTDQEINELASAHEDHVLGATPKAAEKLRAMLDAQAADVVKARLAGFALKDGVADLAVERLKRDLRKVGQDLQSYVESDARLESLGLQMMSMALDDQAHFERVTAITDGPNSKYRNVIFLHAADVVRPGARKDLDTHLGDLTEWALTERAVRKAARKVIPADVMAMVMAPANDAGPDFEAQDMRFGFPDLRSSKTALTGKRRWRWSEGAYWSDLLTDAMSGWSDGKVSVLALVPGRALFSELGKNLFSAKAYLRAKEEMDALRNGWHARADKVAQAWRTLGNKDRAKNQDMMNLMHEATIDQVDPSLPDTWTHPFEMPARRAVSEMGDDAPAWAQDVMGQIARHKATYRKLREKFDALPPDLQAMFRKVRDEHSALADDIEKTLIENVGKAARIAVKRAERAYRKEMNRIRDEGLEGEEREIAEQVAKEKRDAVVKSGGWASKVRMAQLRQSFEKNRLKGPYFPLARFGDLFLTVRDETGAVVSFSRFEKAADQREAVEDATAELLASMEGASQADKDRAVKARIQSGALSQTDSLREMVDPRFASEVMGILQDAGADKATLDAVWQHWLETLPDRSIRKNRIHRKNRKGFDQDAFRAFGKSMFHGAHQLAKLKYGMEMEEHLNDADEEAARQDDPVRAQLIVNEMKKRHAFTMDPKASAFVQFASGVSFIWYLGLSPAAAIANLSQTTVVGVPVLTAHFGMKKAKGVVKELAKASADFARGRGGVVKRIGGVPVWTEQWSAENSSTLTADEKAAIEEAYRRGTLDKTQSHDLAGVQETGIEYNARRERVMRIIGFLFHHTERFNREVTFLASYRLARRDGQTHEEAIQTGADLTWKTHFDYQASSKPRIMQGDDAKNIIFIFKNFTVSMLWRLFRDTHQMLMGATPEVRQEARTQLIGISLSMFAHAGIRGIWGYGLLMMLLGAFLPGEGDDYEEWLQDALLMEGDAPGVAAWNWIMGAALNGIPGHVTGTDLSERIGMPDLWFRGQDRDMEMQDSLSAYVEELLGPALGVVVGGVRGMDMVLDGEVYRGIETAVPKPMRDAMKAGRFMVEGATTLNDDPLVEEFSPLQLIAQLNGFTPAELAERYRINNRLKNAEKRIMDRRREIQHGIGDAVMDGKPIPADLLDEMRAFNREYPEYPITRDSLKQSIAARRRASQNNEAGIVLNPKLNARLRADLAPAVYQ